MKTMKKSLLFVVLLGVASLVSAQTMKVQSAYSDMKNGRLLNAKQNIDDACKDEKTSRESKTWNYAGLIYAQIVQALDENSTADKKTKKELKKLTESQQQICQQGLENFKKCLALEKEANSTEFVGNSIEAMKVLCGYSYKFVGDIYNSGKYEEAIPLFAQLAENANIAKYKEIELEAKFFQADCYRMLQNKDKQMEIYRELAKLNTPRPEVYLSIYQENRASNDTAKAINALKKGVKMTKDNKNASIAMKSALASAYIWANQKPEADKLVAEMLEGGENDANTLTSVAGVCVDMGDMAKAEELYTKAINIDGKNLNAYRGLGLVFFNTAVDENAAAEKLPPDPEFDAEYNAHKKACFDAFEKSVPYFTKVLELDTKNFDALKALKTVYSQLMSRSDATPESKAEYKAKYQDVSARLQELIK